MGIDAASAFLARFADAEHLEGRIKALAHKVTRGKAETGDGPVPVVIENATIRQQTLNHLNLALELSHGKVSQAH